ncbi:ABC transporter family substrate-binding protein [Isoptericola hypogeus]|uniref:ABC transporter family substrate-binding protein n=1 Tax=Isoptericola hypogeus TaxID=300179 RepID=A0ABN2JHJ7_9MICO
MKVQSKSIAFAALLAVALTACSGGDDGGSGESLKSDELASQAQYNPQPRDNVEDGGTFTRAVGEIPDNLNTLHADKSADTAALSMMYNPQLQLIAEDGALSWNKDYVTDVSEELVDGNRVVTYTINDEAVFNDGTPIDWRAFEALWKVSNGKNEKYAPVSTEGYSLITSVEPGENDKQAVVTYDGPWLWWQSQFKEVIHPDAAKDPETFNTAYTMDAHDEWGAGPYHVKELEPGGTTAVFERNPHWWGNPGKLDEFVFRAMESTAAINAFRNGELDAVSATSAENLAQIEGMEGIDVRKAATLAVTFMHVNASSPKLKDADVRKAVHLGIDRQTLQDVRYDGMGWDAELPGMVTLYPFQEGYRDTYSEIGGGYDPEEAGKLLDGAGWSVGDDGIREKDGEKLQLLFPIIGDASYSKNGAVALQAMLKEIGIDLKLDYRSADEFTDTYTKKDYDLFSLNWGTADPDENFFYFCYFYCSDAGYVDQETIDTYAPVVQEIGQETDKVKAVEAFLQTEKDILSTWQIDPLYTGPTIFAVKEGMANFGADLFFFGPIEDIGWQKG